jgi:16S rRNA (uracil1498-N3)-methyltransferase
MSDSIFFAPDIRQHPFLTEDESQHCVKVLRMKEGEQIVVTDGKGFFYDCTLLQAHPKRCAVGIDRVTQIDKTRNEHIHIAFAPVKNMDRNECFAEKRLPK